MREKGTEMREHPQAVASLRRVRARRWLVVLAWMSGPTETRWFPSRVAANAWLCLRLEQGVLPAEGLTPTG
ncbi:MAG: hypothetical protein ACOZB0_04750 [Pseudomonadota bacterium]